jgi:hypothetical protein
LPAEVVDETAQVGGIIPASHDKLIEHFGNHSLAGVKARGTFVRTPLAGRRAETNKAFVAPAVVMALEAKDELPASMGTGESESAQYGLGCRIVEPHELRGGDHLLESFGHLDLQLALCRPMGTRPGLGRNRIGHAGWCVPEEKRSLSQLEIQVIVIVYIPEVGARAAREVERYGSFLLANGAVHPASD